MAINLFQRQGYFATSISEIARQCGIQKASIYYHYPSKENILFHIQQVTMDELTTYLRDNLAYELERRVQRPLYYAIVDEVDNIQIDVTGAKDAVGNSQQDYAPQVEFSIEDSPKGPQATNVILL